MPYLTGLGLGLSLIVAIGAQNAFVLRQGIRREHLLAVALICALSDAVLIALGVSGVGMALQAVPWLVVAVRWVGVAFLVCYALLALKRAWRPSGEALSGKDEGLAGSGAGGAVATKTRTATLTATVLTTLAITWLNPHVYLDTVFLLGSIAQAQSNRLLFALGAITGSFAWFFALAYGARFLGRWLSTPKAWRVLDACIAIVMLAIAGSLALGR